MMRIIEGGTGDSERFRRLLDEQFEWPAPYMFKFIVPLDRLVELESLLEGHELETKASSKGNYVSVTLSPIMESSESVIDLYSRVGHVEGLLAL